MNVSDLFNDPEIVQKIQNILPELFLIAELESSRAGKVGMEVGSLREKILISLLIYKFGHQNVDAEIPITETEVDVRVFGDPISIKTYSGNNLGGYKLIWTVDGEQARRFQAKHIPTCDTILVQVNWNALGGIYYFSDFIQRETLQNIGRERYIKLPKAGKNPRGVKITREAVEILLGFNS